VIVKSLFLSSILQHRNSEYPTLYLLHEDQEDVSDVGALFKVDGRRRDVVQMAVRAWDQEGFSGAFAEQARAARMDGGPG
jgi:hypothetical protein